MHKLRYNLETALIGVLTAAGVAVQPGDANPNSLPEAHHGLDADVKNNPCILVEVQSAQKSPDMPQVNVWLARCNITVQSNADKQPGDPVVETRDTHAALVETIFDVLLTHNAMPYDLPDLVTAQAAGVQCATNSMLDVSTRGSVAERFFFDELTFSLVVSPTT